MVQISAIGPILNANLFIDDAKESNPDLHAQAVQPKHGWLEKKKAGSEEQTKAQGKKVTNVSFWFMGWVKWRNDPP